MGASVTGPTPKRLLVVRHGETEWSLGGRHTGNTDVPLTEAGRRRARVLGEVLAGRSFSLVLCSPLRRARDTCELAGFGASAVSCEDLREWDYGDYEGLTTAEIRARDPDWSLWGDGCPGGESPGAVGARVDRVLARVREAGGSREAIAFAHGHVLRVLSARWLAMAPAAGSRLALDAGAFGVLGYEHETEVLLRWNASPDA
ncbi:MAG: histidine phosphatase family protein [Solirubrobacteraceae bacterium]